MTFDERLAARVRSVLAAQGEVDERRIETPPPKVGKARHPVARKPSAAVAPPRHGGKFKAALFRYPGIGGWTFVTVPDRLAPPVTHGWGRTPVQATVDGTEWKTSVWRGKDGRTLLAVPKSVRGKKDDGQFVQVEISFTFL